MPRISSPSLDLAVHEYLKYSQQYNKKSHVTESEGLYRRYLKEKFGQRKLSTITRKELQSLHAQLSESAGKAAANKAIELLSVVYNKALDWDLFEGRNPATRIKKNKLASRKRFLSRDEVARFFQAAKHFLGTNGGDIALLGLMTGARSGNLLRMQWKELDLKDGVWHIPESKNGDAYDIPLVKPAIEILEQRLRNSTGSEYVFPSVTGHKAHLENPRKTFNLILKMAGIEDFRFHDLRRSLGSWMAITGSSLVVIGRALNHRDPKSTMIYARVDLSPVRHAMELALDSLLSYDSSKTLQAIKSNNNREPITNVLLIQPSIIRSRPRSLEDRFVVLQSRLGYAKPFNVAVAQEVLQTSDSHTRDILTKMIRKGWVIKAQSSERNEKGRLTHTYQLCCATDELNPSTAGDGLASSS